MVKSRVPNLKDNALWFAKWVVAGIIAMWSQIPGQVAMLITFMGIDMLTGLIAAYQEKSLDSRVTRKGLTRKLLTLILLYVIHVLEQQAHIELGLEKIAAVAYIINEAISIVENCAKSGVPIPEALVSTLKRFQKLSFDKSPETGQYRSIILSDTTPKTGEIKLRP